MTGTAVADLPRWDLTAIYPGVDSGAYRDSVTRFSSLVDELESLLADAEAVDPGDIPAVTAAFDRLIGVFNEAVGLGRLNYWFLQGHIWTNARDTVAQARMSELEAIRTRRTIAESQFVAWLGRLDIEALVAASPEAAAHAFLLRQARIAAAHQMDQPREVLAATLQQSGGFAWSRMQETLSSQLMVTIQMPDGETVRMPVAESSKFSIDPDRDIRRRSYEGRRDAWRGLREACAAAMNGVSGERIVLTRERGWASILDASLFKNRLGRETLEVMFDACRHRLPDFQRFLTAKARVLGIERLATYDLWAPMPDTSGTWTWEEAATLVVQEFAAFSPELGALARRALDEQWIDAEPRADKDGGAVCLPMNDGASRVLMNFIGVFDDVLALAHELGHAYHNQCDAAVTHWRRNSRPTILAETASTFCETLVARAALKGSDETDRLSMLDATLMAATMTVPRMLAAFEFEQAIYERRAERTLSADELDSLLRECTVAAHGDAIDHDAMGEFSWQGTPHFYMPDLAFYNYPYTFGMLFGLGLYAQYLDTPDTFHGQFATLLASTGDADAVTLTREFGIDIQSPAFWEGSLDVVAADIDAFVELAEAHFPARPEQAGAQQQRV